MSSSTDQEPVRPGATEAAAAGSDPTSTQAVVDAAELPADLDATILRRMLLDERASHRRRLAAVEATFADLVASAGHTEPRAEQIRKLRADLVAARERLLLERDTRRDDREQARQREERLRDLLAASKEKIAELRSRLGLRSLQLDGSLVDSQDVPPAELVALREGLARVADLLAEDRDGGADAAAARREASRLAHRLEDVAESVASAAEVAEAAPDGWHVQRSTASYPYRHMRLFQDLRDCVGIDPDRTPKFLSFGCSIGFEAFDMRHAHPLAAIYGCDINDSALAMARALWAAYKFDIFKSTPEAIAARGPFTAITALNVLTRYPEIQGRDDIADIYPFAEFDRTVGSLAGQVEPGGYLVIYNACYLFEQSAAAAGFEPVAPNRNSRNGWIDKYDRSGRRVAVLDVAADGNAMDTQGFRKNLKVFAKTEEDVEYDHRILDPSIPVDLVTTIWRRKSG